MGKNKFFAKLGLCVLSAVVGAAAFASCADDDSGNGGNKNGVTSADDNVKFEDIVSDKLLNAAALEAAFKGAECSNFSVKFNMQETEYIGTAQERAHSVLLETYKLADKEASYNYYDCDDDIKNQCDFYFAEKNGNVNGYKVDYNNGVKASEGVCDPKSLSIENTLLKGVKNPLSKDIYSNVLANANEWFLELCEEWTTDVLKKTWEGKISFKDFEALYNNEMKGYCFKSITDEEGEAADTYIFKFLNGKFIGFGRTLYWDYETSNGIESESSWTLIYNIGTTSVSLPEEMKNALADKSDEKGDENENNGMETPEIVDNYPSITDIYGKQQQQDIVGEEMSAEKWKNAFDESLYNNVSVNLLGIDFRDGCASVIRYYKAGDRGYFDMTSFEHNFDYGTNEAYYVRKNGGKTEYLSAVHSSTYSYSELNDWQWATFDAMKNQPDVQWSWNCFGYLALGGLENQYSAFTYNAETGEYTANNISVIFCGETDTMEKVSVKFVGGKVATMYVEGWEYPLYMVFSDFGTTAASAFEQISAANWGQAFDKILENRDFYMSVNDGAEIKERWHINGDLADVKDKSWKEIHYYDIQDGVVYEQEITDGARENVEQPATVASVLEKLFGKVAENYSAFSYDKESKMYVCDNFTANGKTETVRVKIVGGYVRYIEFESEGEGGAKEICGYAFYSYNDMIVAAKKMG